MSVLFSLLVLASTVALVIGLIKPSLVKMKSRKYVAPIFIGAIFAFAILAGAASPIPQATPAPVAQVVDTASQNIAITTSTATSTHSATIALAPSPTPAKNQTPNPVVTQNQTQQAPRPAPAQPTASIKANGSTGSATISYNTAATVNWSSANANSCTVSPSGWSGTSGNQGTGNLTSARTYSLSCSGSGGSASASVTVNVSAPPAPPSPSPITLSGNGQSATQQFTLQQGLSIFTLQNSGQRNFIVDLLDSNGNEVANLTNAIGDFSGSQAVNISPAGSYLLNVQSDGPWSITVTQPRTTSAQAVSNLSGTGDEATQFFNLTSGLHTFTLTNSGSGNFIVDLLDKNGNEVDNLENEIGDFNGSTAVHIDNGGPYLLNIQSGGIKSSGNWTVQIQ